MLKVREAIIVEGTYDKIKLDQIVEATIITTNGFGIFKDKSKIELIKQLAQKTGIVILTDSDRAGFLIRNYIKQWVPKEFIKHAYIPEIKGKEKRKTVPGKEGLLGVEGVTPQVIEESLRKAGCIVEQKKEIQKSHVEITKTDLYNDGFMGRSNSRLLRKKLTDQLNLPSKISTNTLLQVLNTLYTYEDYERIRNTLFLNTKPEK
jgi:ribonuclease M5